MTERTAFHVASPSVCVHVGEEGAHVVFGKQ